MLVMSVCSVHGIKQEIINKLLQQDIKENKAQNKIKFFTEQIDPNTVKFKFKYSKRNPTVAFMNIPKSLELFLALNEQELIKGFSEDTFKTIKDNEVTVHVKESIGKDEVGSKAFALALYTKNKLKKFSKHS